jgi:hypothetical protein
MVVMFYLRMNATEHNRRMAYAPCGRRTATRPRGRSSLSLCFCGDFLKFQVLHERQEVMACE